MKKYDGIICGTNPPPFLQTFLHTRAFFPKQNVRAKSRAGYTTGHESHWKENLARRQRLLAQTLRAGIFGARWRGPPVESRARRRRNFLEICAFLFLHLGAGLMLAWGGFLPVIEWGRTGETSERGSRIFIREVYVEDRWKAMKDMIFVSEGNREGISAAVVDGMLMVWRSMKDLGRRRTMLRLEIEKECSRLWFCLLKSRRGNCSII
jgi:hypothetical protein